MIDERKEFAYSAHLEARPTVKKLVDWGGSVLTKKADEVFHSAEKGAPVVVMGIPAWNENLSKYFSPEFFQAYLDIYNPLHLTGDELYEYVKKFTDGQKKGAYVSKPKVIASGGQVGLMRFDHARELARSGFLGYGERALRITGLELVMAEVFLGSEGFNHLMFDGDSGRPLGKRTLINDLFDTLPKPLPVGSVIEIFNKEHIYRLTVLPIVGKYDNGEDFKTPYFALLGTKDHGNLTRARYEARMGGQRIVVFYKDGQQPLARAFTKPQEYTDFIELTDDEKWTVTYLNGKKASDVSLPPIKIGRLQIVGIPIKGKVETFIVDEMDAVRRGVCRVPDVFAIFGLDTVERGITASDHGLIPVDFRSDGDIEVNGDRILGWHKNNNILYDGYLKENAIMPVQPVGAQVLENQLSERRDGHVPSQEKGFLRRMSGVIFSLPKHLARQK